MSVTHGRKTLPMAATPYPVQHPGARDPRHDRRLSVGAEVQSEGGVHFRVWATQPQHVEVVLEGGPGQTPGAAPMMVALEPEGHGHYSGLVAEAGAGTRYRYRLDGGAEGYADPASRFQPDGPHGPSQVIDL